MREDTVYCVTPTGDSSHTPMTRDNEPHSELLQFWEIPEIDCVICITQRCDLDHTSWSAARFRQAFRRFRIARLRNRATRPHCHLRALTNHMPL